MDNGVYHSPFDERYTSLAMNQLFSPDNKFSTWRKLWVALARAEQELGLNISDEQIREMERFVHNINYDVANAREKIVRHDVMAHVYAFGKQATSAAGIIHLGATSCYVTDNTDLILIRDAFQIVRGKLLGVIKLLADFANNTKSIPTLGYTHYQPATPTTVGKRATLWLQNFVENLEELDFVVSRMKMLGCRGATGSSETFMKLFDGSEEKCLQLDSLIAKEFGFVREEVQWAASTDFDGHWEKLSFTDVYPVSGQTYPRNFDYRVLNALAAIGASAYKMAQDIRLLQHDKEIEEPFSKNQIGSSAMAYKRNPMRSERICSLARYLSNLPNSAWGTAATQMLERSLDDSAGRRLYIPDAFRAADAVLKLCANVVDGLVINRGVINARLGAELPFMVTEAIIMKAAMRGADRQKMHDKIRGFSIDLGRLVKEEGWTANIKDAMVSKVAEDAEIPLSSQDVIDLLETSKLIGRCPGQVADYLSSVVDPLLEANKEEIVLDSDVKV